MSAPLYNADILRLAASIPYHQLLDHPQAQVRRSSPICGSRVTVDLGLDEAGKVAVFGQEVRACALGQASAAIMGRHILGQTPQDLALARDALKDWLRGEGDLPEPLQHAFPELALFQPARAHPARHPSILLAFEAAAEAAHQALTSLDA